MNFFHPFADNEFLLYHKNLQVFFVDHIFSFLLFQILLGTLPTFFIIHTHFLSIILSSIKYSSKYVCVIDNLYKQTMLQFVLFHCKLIEKTGGITPGFLIFFTLHLYDLGIIL